VDGLELNLSCPHGLPERRMGSAMGQNPAMVEDVCRWVRAITSKPVWAKMTPNITSVVEPAKAAVAGGASGITAINTILSVMGVDLDTLRPMPTVEGWSEPGGYSYIAMRPIALRMVSEIARALPGVPVSGVGGVATSGDAIQFMLLGAGTVQVCTAAMLQGMGIIGELCEGTLAWMQRQGFETLDDFRGHSLQYFTTHADLVARHDTARRERRQAAAAAQMQREGQAAAAASLDNAWEGDRLTQQTDDLSQPVLNRS
jgi:dihydroorotate dehydrogenase subfamily 1